MKKSLGELVKHAGKRLLVPFKASTGKTGIATRGTRIFVEQGVDLPKELQSERREVKRGLQKNSTLDLRLAQLDNIGKISAYRRALAEESDFYIKPVTILRRKIRNLLVRNQIPVEAPIEELGNGLELFKRGNWWPLGRLRLNEDSLARQIEELVSKMHHLGITHNHLHAGNFVCSPDAKVKLIDLSKAKLFVRKPRNKKEFLLRFSQELHQELLREIDVLLCRHSNAFGITSEEIARYIYLVK